MSRSLLALMLLGVIGAAQGCRICDSPYDYCSPVMPCGDSCGAGGCGHSHGGYIESGYSGGHGGCATCGNGGGYSGHTHEYEEGTVIQESTMPSRSMQGQPTPAPLPAPEMTPPQTRRPSVKTMTKATHEAPAPVARKPNPAARTASKGSGPIFW